MRKVVTLVVVALWCLSARAQNEGPYFESFDRFEVNDLFPQSVGGSSGVDGLGGFSLVADASSVSTIVELDPTQRVIPASDFDLRVSFRDLDLVVPSALAASMEVSVRSLATGARVCSIGRRLDSASSSTYFASSTSVVNTIGTVASGDTVGTLRIVRSGNTYDLYFYQPATSPPASPWVQVNSVPLVAPREPVSLEFSISRATASMASATLDDLIVMLPSDDCPSTTGNPDWEIELGRPLVLDLASYASTAGPSDPTPSCLPLGLANESSNVLPLRPATSDVRVRVLTGFAPEFPESQVGRESPSLALYAGDLSTCLLSGEIACASGVLSGPTDVTLDADGLSPGAVYPLYVNVAAEALDRRQVALVVTSPVVYVDAAAPPGGDGQTWGSAFSDLQDALWLASLGVLSSTNPVSLLDEVRVAQGTYRPGDAGERFATFRVPSGLQISGGYRGAHDGTGLAPDDRDLNLFSTVLSGDLLGNDIYAPGQPPLNNDENSIHVVVCLSGDDMVLDGLEVLGGNGTIGLNTDGGGILGGVGSLIAGSNCVIRDCRIAHNVAANGAGISFLQGSLELNRVRLEDNHATGFGGGLLFLGGLIITGDTFSANDCVFIRNHAEYSGAAQVQASATTVTDTAIEGNASMQNSVFSILPGAGLSNPLPFFGSLTGCRFESNQTSAEFGVCAVILGNNPLSGPEQLNVLDCEFLSGGGLYVSLPGELMVARIERCRFSQVTAGPVESSPLFFFTGGTGLVSDSVFEGNSGFPASAIQLLGNANSTLTVDRCSVQGNAGVPGTEAAVYVQGQGEFVVANSLVAGNANGGISVHNPVSLPSGSLSVSLLGSTVVDNGGPGVQFDEPAGTLEIRSSILWSNLGADVDLVAASALTGGYSLWSGATAVGLPGQIFAVPDFFDPSSQDYRLTTTSPAVDAGDNSWISPDLSLDLAGNPRREDEPAVLDSGQGTAPVCDMGCYEKAPGCQPVSGLTCERTGSDVELNWDLGDSYLQVWVYRDGSPLWILGGLDTSYVDVGAPAGSVEYAVEGRCGFGGVPAPGLQVSCTLQNLYKRGDCNADGMVDIADAVSALGVLFSGGATPLCRDACDANNDQGFDIGDPIYLLTFLFAAGAPPAAPFPDCGGTTQLGCSSYPPCAP